MKRRARKYLQATISGAEIIVAAMGTLFPYNHENVKVLQKTVRKNVKKLSDSR